MIHCNQHFTLVSTLFAALLSLGCSRESVQRTSYETLESIRVQQCMDRLDAECPTGRTSYEDYQSKREQLQAQDQ